MFDDIGKIASVVSMLITEHDISLVESNVMNYNRLEFFSTILFNESGYKTFITIMLAGNHDFNEGFSV